MSPILIGKGVKIMREKLKMVKDSPETRLADAERLLTEMGKQNAGLIKVNQELLDELYFVKQLLHTYLGEQLEGN
jgi:hypothetical protein